MPIVEYTCYSIDSLNAYIATLGEFFRKDQIISIKSEWNGNHKEYTILYWKI
jgi:hypothetical protein